MATLKKVLAENQRLRAANHRLELELSQAQEELSQQRMGMAQLKAQVDWLQQKLFGNRRSEKLDPRQSELRLGIIEEEPPWAEETLVEAHPRKKGKRGLSRDEAYEHLPIEETQEYIPEEVQANPQAYERTGASEETTEIDYHPPRFFRRRIVRPKFRHKNDRSQPLVIAPALPRVVEGLPAANLLATIMGSKFLDHLPLYRQARIYKRHGCSFAVESLVRWVEKVALWLKPIYAYMRWELLQGNYLQADETPVNFCDPDLGLKKSRTGYFCVYSRPGGNVVFVWRLGRSYEQVTGFLEGYQGLLQTDAYSPYLTFAKINPGITLLGCMAHARRKFFEAQKYSQQTCKEVLELIRQLYQVEKEIRESIPALTDAQIVEKRQHQSAPIHQELKEVLKHVQDRHYPQEPVRKAADYTLGNWNYLCEYLNHGQTQIDNNLIENKIRPTAIGKKNWLFIGHPKAGDRAAILYSILVSCEHFGVDPRTYLCHVFAQDTLTMSNQALATITPHAYAQSLQEKSHAA